MSWNTCTYITQSNSTDVRNHHYENAYSQCVSEVNMSSSIYVTEDSEFKLYINSGTQSGSLIYTSPSHDLDSEEVGESETGNFCPNCKGFFVQENKENMMYKSRIDTTLYISHSQYLEYSSSNCNNEDSQSRILSLYPEKEEGVVYSIGWTGVTGSLKDDGIYTIDETTLTKVSGSLIPVTTKISTSGSVDPWSVQFWTD